MTTHQVLERTKTVTRRDPRTWENLRPGDRLIAVEQAQGLPKGATQVALGVIEVVSVRVESIELVDEQEMVREGFPGRDPADLREWWWRLHRQDRCRRIEFRYVDDANGEAVPA